MNRSSWLIPVQCVLQVSRYAAEILHESKFLLVDDWLRRDWLSKVIVLRSRF